MANKGKLPRKKKTWFPDYGHGLTGRYCNNICMYIYICMYVCILYYINQIRWIHPETPELSSKSVRIGWTLSARSPLLQWSSTALGLICKPQAWRCTWWGWRSTEKDSVLASTNINKWRKTQKVFQNVSMLTAHGKPMVIQWQAQPKWAVFKIPVLFHYTGWFIRSPRSWIIIPNILGSIIYSIIPYNHQPAGFWTLLK